MSSSKRDAMTRKRQTQVELEKENAELKKQVQQLQRRLKQSLRQLKKHEEIQLDINVALDLEQEATFQDMLAGKPDEDPADDFIVVTLPNGNTKKIRKRMNE